MRPHDPHTKFTRPPRPDAGDLTRAYRRGVADGEAMTAARRAPEGAWPGRLDAALRADVGVREDELTRVLTAARPGAKLRVEAYDPARADVPVTDVRATRREDVTWTLTTRLDDVVVQSEINGARAVARALTDATRPANVHLRVGAREPERVEPREGVTT